jgi:flavin reductase (DIM6/NTAB) family NADH-FMN oxidoreductase RutF
MTLAMNPEPRFVDQTIFRDVVGHFTTGVAVITTSDGDRRYGVTASAVSSVSLDPPMLLVCLNRRLPTCDAIAERGVFAVNILDEEQGQLAKQFATRHPDKFRDIAIGEGELGVPLLAQALAHLECRVADQVDAATHTVFLGEVQVATARTGSPLAYFRGTFGRFEHAGEAAA